MTAGTRRLLPPLAMTAAMLVVLLGLGSWQVRRMVWKESMLAQIAAAEGAPPIPLKTIPPPFAKISVSGVFLPERTALYGAEVRTTSSGTAMGARMIVPFQREDGGILLVDRGWAPLNRTIPLDLPTGPVAVTGYARFADAPGWFSAKDDLAALRFYTLDPAAMGMALGQTGAAPFVLVALGPAAAAGHWPDPARTLPRPPNNHLIYAITWFGLAIALLTIFAIWARKGPRA